MTRALFFFCFIVLASNLVCAQDKIKKIVPKCEIPDNINLEPIEKAVIYPGCEKFTRNGDLKKCMSNAISKYVNENFNFNLVKSPNLKGSLQTIYVRFKINEDGNIENIEFPRTSQKVLQNEVKRVISGLPNMISGKQRNKPIAILYVLPIIISLE